MHTRGSPKTVVDRMQKNRKERNQSQDCISALMCLQDDTHGCEDNLVACDIH